MRYSVCITTFNDARTVRRSLDTLFACLPPDSEVVVVDSESTDGSTEILREYAKRGLLKHMVRRCSIGMGRQLAFLNSAGDYILSAIDTDDFYNGELPRILEEYHALYDGSVLKAWDLIVIPRRIAARIGWRDQHTAEDLHFLKDAEAAGFRVAYRDDWSIKSNYVRRRYRGPFRFLEMWRQFSDFQNPVLLDAYRYSQRVKVPNDRLPLKLNAKWRIVWLACVATRGKLKGRLLDSLLWLGGRTHR